MTIAISRALQCPVLSLDYRLAPENPFPAGLQDALLAYYHLTKVLGVPASNVIIAGDSAGGGLSMALLLALQRGCQHGKEKSLPLPGGAILLSPFVDLTHSLASWVDNASTDYLNLPDPSDALYPPLCYLGGPSRMTDPALQHPFVSPLFAPSFRGLPPILIQLGAAENLRDEGVLLAHRLAKDGVERCRLELWEDFAHVFQMLGHLEGAKLAFRAMAEWVEQSLPVQAASKETSHGPARWSEMIDGEIARGKTPTTVSHHPNDGKLANKLQKEKKALKKTIAPFTFKPIQGYFPPTPKVASHLSQEKVPRLRQIIEEYEKDGPAQGTIYYKAVSTLPEPDLMQSFGAIAHL